MEAIHLVWIMNQKILYLFYCLFTVLGLHCLYDVIMYCVTRAFGEWPKGIRFACLEGVVKKYFFRTVF